MSGFLCRCLLPKDEQTSILVERLRSISGGVCELSIQLAEGTSTLSLGLVLGGNLGGGRGGRTSAFSAVFLGVGDSVFALGGREE